MKLFYPCRVDKGADQLCSYYTADGQKSIFSHDVAHRLLLFLSCGYKQVM